MSSDNTPTYETMRFTRLGNETHVFPSTTSNGNRHAEKKYNEKKINNLARDF